ncbi:3-dehydroquinate synthase [Cellulomonas xiejunii]|uniref:3-dehydroquinate synthase n=1 Tax=Cellulomonas xiejunii TaxID=2968083 RepID=A0ABY5KL21_9CELL|nr:3-dehydroquinate synthase family protein [Cellulomonas xiejunii]MCC2312907.1 3-dehydroquinate synthase [Cellulomonas xiejunii]MCC2320223.1 3-dehydroquinate synthase [Cellulomonas xiejunii]UUI70530.1 3-dehydroquinate synthase [Cellulomonas xiejunii]
MVAFSDFVVSTSGGSYEVRIGRDELDAALASASVVLVDAALVDQLPPLAVPVVEIEASESAKTLAGCERVILALRESGVRRSGHLVAVGGGVVQDVATFVAQVYMRGIDWTYVPTTLMAMADSCIGGKSSINVGDVKNLVGGIYPPTAVAVDPRFLPSLGPAALGCGFSEAVKIAFCRGPEAFDRYLETYESFGAEPLELIDHVLRCKKWFIEVDEYDRKERRLLNFGHTFGHALESAVAHRVPHGLAVSIGVLCAAAHPQAARGPEVDRLVAHCRSLLASAGGVAEGLADFDHERYEKAFRADKKHDEHHFRLILPAPGGGVAEVSVGNGPDDWRVIRDLTTDILATLTGRQ